ncbi:glycosyltransferase [Hymenobacter sp. BT18]|uniref:glycosyltransferase n=1 Tax=Hymenobacter sp. BT18 TaxID=2835648 RepID=UPI00143E19C8|nr:glycosyltransferase [Hymenobacter sp. BT18]QIX62142.1 glycosyltransferase [Hymenobacter sp. BT18]
MDLVSPQLFHHAAAPTELPVAPLRMALPPHPALRASIIIPAKNEAAELPATLAALVAQTTLARQPLDPTTFEILVLANNCTDATVQVVRRFAAKHPAWAIQVAEQQLPPAEAHVGRARRLLMDEACCRLEAVGRPQGLILSTDADTQVTPTWLAATEQAISAGADAVGGRILPRHSGPMRCAVRRQHLLDAAYRLARTQLEASLDASSHDPWPRHHQHFGASLALTAAAYRAVGGLPVVPFLEDEALYHSLLRHDLRVRHCPAVRVATSDRRAGRVAVGLSWQLSEWARQCAAGQEPLVEGGHQVTAEAMLRRRLRRLWLSAKRPLAGLLPLAKQLNVGAEELICRLTAATCFGVLWEWALGRFRQVRPLALVPLRQALAEIRAQLGQATLISFPADLNGK